MWKKFIAVNSKPNPQTYPELPESITWFRLFLGLAYGITLGFRESQSVVTVTGAPGVMMGFNVVTFIPLLYMKLYLNVDFDSYDKITFTGCMSGIAVFLLVWIFFFTMLHEDEEKALGGGLLDLNATVAGIVNATIQEEPEF